MLYKQFWLVLSIFVFALNFCVQAKETLKSPPDILTVPQFSAKLPAGTIAWALIDQVHPTQAYTGHREVDRKATAAGEICKKGEFSPELYEAMYTKSLVPGYSGPVHKDDSRSGEMDALFYNTDRTHFTFAMAKVFVKLYGEKALTEVIKDKDGRPLNVVLVMVEGNKSKLSFAKFAKFMKDEGHAYLVKWMRGPGGIIRFGKYKFSQLPEKVYETVDAPFRWLVSWLQRHKFLERVSSDYSQFIGAEEIAKNSGIKEREIDENASPKSIKKAKAKAVDFLENNPLAKKVPGSPTYEGEPCKSRIGSMIKKLISR